MRFTKELRMRPGQYVLINPTFDNSKAALNKLADYENLEEKRRLVVLPFRVGDTVYVNPVGDKIVKGVVTELYVEQVVVLIRVYDGRTAINYPPECIFGTPEEVEVFMKSNENRIN